AKRWNLTPGPRLVARVVDLIEGPAIGEVGGLGLIPTAELIDGDQRYAGKGGRIFGRHRRQTRTVVVLGRQFLGLRAVEVFQVFFRDGASAVLVDHLVDHGHGRFGQDT